MAAKLADGHYGRLTGQERFALMVEAMARGDEREADRLEETCPKQAYRCEDPEFRDRMRRAYMIASQAWMGMQAGLAQLRLARAYQEYAGGLAEPVVELAQLAFLYGREYGKWEAGAIDSIGLPEPEAVGAEVSGDPELAARLKELRVLGAEAAGRSATELREALVRVQAADLLARWEGFGLFCRRTLDLDPMAVLAAFGISAEAVSAVSECPGVSADAAATTAWAERWGRLWARPFSDV